MNLQDPSCQQEAAAGGRSRTCAAEGPSGDQTRVCSIGYGIDATDCCFGWTFDLKPIASLMSSIVLGVREWSSNMPGMVGWCDPIQISEIT